MIRRRPGIVSFVFLLSTLCAHAAGALPGIQPPFQITGMGASFDASHVTLTIAVQGETARPAYQVYFNPSDCTVVVDMRNVDASAAVLPNLPQDSLVRGWELRHPNCVTSQWVVKLGYAVPTSSLHARFLQGQLVVTLARNFFEQQTLQVTRNVSWHRQELRSGDDFTLLNELEIRLDNDVALRLAHAGDSTTVVEDPTDLARRKKALAMVNGGFFKYHGGPLSLVVDEGKIIVPNVSTRPPRTALGITNDGRILMNRVEVQDERLHVVDGQADWSNVTYAIGGGPRLIRDGKPALTVDDEALGPKGNDITHKAGRTVVARLKNGHLLLVTISGYRDNHSQGWQFPQLVGWLLARGAEDAMCLDGGGSVAMVLDGVLVSREPGRTAPQRKIANGLMLTDTAPDLLPAGVQVSAAMHRVNADGATPVKVSVRVTQMNGKPVADGTPVFFATTAGVITPVGYTLNGRAITTFTPLRAIGQSRILAYAGVVGGEDDVSVMGGAPRRLVAKVVGVHALPTSSLPSKVDGTTAAVTGAPGEATMPQATNAPGPRPTPAGSPTAPPLGPQGPRVATFEASVLDAWQNALPDQDIEIAGQHVRSGADGIARVDLALPPQVHMVHVAGGALPPLDVAVP